MAGVGVWRIDRDGMHGERKQWKPAAAGDVFPKCCIERSSGCRPLLIHPPSPPLPCPEKICFIISFQSILQVIQVGTYEPDGVTMAHSSSR